MRRSFKTTEFYVTVILLCLVFYKWKEIDPAKIALVVDILISSYILGRSIFKRMRGDHLYTGTASTEFWLSIIGIIWIVYLYLYGGLDISMAIIHIVIIQGVYNLSRGWAKSLVRNVQVIR